MLVPLQLLILPLENRSTVTVRATDPVRPALRFKPCFRFRVVCEIDGGLLDAYPHTAASTWTTTQT